MPNATAQETSTVYSEDTLSTQESAYDRMYRLTLADRSKIYTIFKFNAVDWGLLKPSFIVEQNLFNNFNIEPHIKLADFHWDINGGIKYAFESGIDLKYYYNINRRNKLGKRTNGFVGNYFGVSGLYTISDYSDYVESMMIKQSLDDHFEKQDVYNIWAAELKYGVQRRLGTFGYVDVQAGARYIHYVNLKENVHPFIRIGIGFGLSKDKALDLIKE